MNKYMMLKNILNKFDIKVNNEDFKDILSLTNNKTEETKFQKISKEYVIADTLRRQQSKRLYYVSPIDKKHEFASVDIYKVLEYRLEKLKEGIQTRIWYVSIQ